MDIGGAMSQIIMFLLALFFVIWLSLLVLYLLVSKAISYLQSKLEAKGADDGRIKRYYKDR